MTVFVARALDAVKDALNSSSKTVTIVLFDPSPHPAEGYVSFYSEESPVDNLARALSYLTLVL
jgi:hypothetical protein